MKEKVKKKLSAEQFLTEAFEVGLKQWQKKSEADHAAKSDRAWNVFRVSQIGDCQAADTRDWIGEKGAPESPQSILRMHDGVWTHLACREILKLSGLKLIHEERHLKKTYVVKLDGGVKVELTIVGHQDNAFVYEGQQIVLDFKKASERSFEHMADGDLSSSYWDQMQGYLDLTDLELGIFFIKGVHGEVTAISVDRDEKYWKTVVLPRLARTALKRQRKQIGTRDFHYGQFPCTYCRHCEACWSVGTVDNDKLSRLVPTDPAYKFLQAALNAQALYQEYSEKADKAKSVFRENAIEAIKKAGTTKIKIAKGGVTWVKTKKRSIQFIASMKEQAVEDGYAYASESMIEYPLATKGEK